MDAVFGVHRAVAAMKVRETLCQNPVWYDRGECRWPVCRCPEQHIVWAYVPVPYALLVRLRERGDPAAAIVRILEQVLGQEVVPLPPSEHDG